ncbi:MAG: FimB/Mfa2 family fimbrial subunit [Muribaculaceae bacterium]|nr:FimB/Mfa2 family fimbrial subunit [Muribaculaceae bacterium]
MKLFNRLFSIFALLASAVALTGCNDMIYDDEGDCDFKVKFVYETNLKFTDAFPAEVFEVTLYVIDPQTGQIIWTGYDSSENLKSKDYTMTVPVPRGTYNLVAWCGRGHRTSFTVAGGQQATHHTDLSCKLTDRVTKTHIDGRDLAHSETALGSLFHGKEDKVAFKERRDPIVVHLTKDTNDIHILLQHLSGENIDPDDFRFAIETENGYMDWDNSLLPDESLVYRPHSVVAGTAGVEIPNYSGAREITSVSTAVAHFTVGRIMEDRARDFWLNIYNKDGERIVHVPFIDYALLVRGYHTRPDGSTLEPQDYLDYQDDYPMTFFLDENGRWMNAYIYIESWRVILQGSEL